MIETTHLSEAMFPELLRKMKENENAVIICFNEKRL